MNMSKRFSQICPRMLEITSRRFWNFFSQQLREHVALQNAMLATQTLSKSATNPVQITHWPAFFFCSVWQPKRAYLGKLVTKLCFILRRAYRIILIVSSVSGSLNLFISSFSDPTFSRPHSTSFFSDFVSLSYFSFNLYKSYCSDWICMFFCANSIRKASISSWIFFTSCALWIIAANWTCKEILASSYLD